MTPPDKPKPFSEMTKDERDAYLRKVHNPEATCLQCGKPYPKKKGVSGYCPACVAASRTKCC